MNNINKDKPLLRIGIVSDTQTYDVFEDWGMSNLAKAFKLLAAKQPEVILMPGDLADMGNLPGAYTLYNELCAAFFGSDQPIQIACAGNHDMWATSPDCTRESLRQAFCRGLNIPEDNPWHTVIKGFDFICITEDLQNDYSDELIAKVEKELLAAVERDPEKPVFVISHYPPYDTMSGSHGNSGKKNLRELFDRFKQVVSISGHTHYPLEDERSIWQKEFTAFTTSTLSYGCVEERPFNSCNTILPFAREVVQALYMELYADRLEIHRYNVEDQRELKPGQLWRVNLPYSPEEAIYTPERALKRTAPFFAAEASLVLRYDYGFVYAIFDAAKHDDMVQFYRIIARRKDADGNWQLAREALYAADFYRLERNQSERCFFKLPCDMFTAGDVYRVEVYPLESFGKAGEPLVIERTIPSFWRFRDTSADIAPQE